MNCEPTGHGNSAIPREIRFGPADISQTKRPIFWPIYSRDQTRSRAAVIIKTRFSFKSLDALPAIISLEYMNTIILGNTLPGSAKDPRHFKFINLSTYWIFSWVTLWKISQIGRTWASKNRQDIRWPSLCRWKASLALLQSQDLI